jgi:hypothetical protein
MDRTLRDLRNFIIKEVFNGNWETEGRKDYYTTNYISIKKGFDDDGWYFRLNGGADKFHSFKSIGVNRFVLYFLFLFIKRNIKVNAEKRKNDGLRNEWNKFLNNNKDINRDQKIDKIIK